MEKIQSLINELENLKNDFENQKKYDSKFEEITNKQINFLTKNGIPDPLKDDIKNLNNIYENYINFSYSQYNFSSKLEELKKVKKDIQTVLNDYIQVLKDNKTNFREIEDANLNKKFLNFYKRINIDLVDQFKSLSSLFNELFKNIIIFANELKKNKETYESYGEKCPKENNILPSTKDEFMNKLYKPLRNIEERIAFIEDTLREIESTKNEWMENNRQFSRRIDKKNGLINDFPNINIEKIKQINVNLINRMGKFITFKFKVEKSDIGINREKMRLDILLILDTTRTMSSFVKDLPDNLKSIIKSIKDDFTLSIPKIGFIGYKDFGDLELGDDYIDIDFSSNYEELYKTIDNIEADGGEGEFKDVAGAFKLALKKSWGQGKKLAILITNSPCHGKEYHNKGNDKYPDGYNDPNNTDYERKKINYYLDEFIKKNIYLIGYDITPIKTEVMYNKFLEFYKGKNKQDLFSKEKGKLKDIICNKVKDLLKDQKKEVMIS